MRIACLAAARAAALAAPLAVSLATALAAGPALAACSDDIAELGKRVETEARASISASTSGKQDAAAREGQGVTGATGGATGGMASSASASSGTTAQAGAGAERAQQAKVALDEARTADGKGDAAACAAAVARVRENLAAAP